MMSTSRYPQKIPKRPKNSSPSASSDEGKPERGASTNGFNHRSSSMGKMEVVKLNLMAIRRMDPQALEIISTVPQVVLYEYEESMATWERTSVEGTLFVYNRSSEPNHGFVILNRLSSNNMHELLRPGMEFRVQSPFVLFKRESGKIYGLCFTDEALTKEIGQLLSRLTVGVVNGHSRSLRAHSVSPSRSSSEPNFGRQEAPRLQEQQGDGHPRVDVMEILENAGRNYLNQPFSDDSSSHDDSPPSELITFTASSGYSHQQHKEDARKLRNAESRRASEPASPRKEPGLRRQRQGGGTHVSGGGSEKRISTPNSYTMPGKGKNARREQQSGNSPKPSRRTASSPKFFESGSRRGHLQQTASFDSKNHPKDSRRSFTGLNNSLPNNRSASPFSTSPLNHAKVGGGGGEGGAGGGTNWNPTPTELATSGFSPSIARKLFSPEQVDEEATTPTAASIPSTPSTLETLFSQASAHRLAGSNNVVTSSSSSSAAPLPLRALSLAEIESQLKAEAPSPEAVNPPAVFTLSASASQDLPRQGSQSSQQDKSQVLLQPAAFATATSGSGSCDPVFRESPLQPFIDPLSVASPGQQQPLSISVEPPTPVVSFPYQGLLLMGTPTTEAVHSHILTSPPTSSFPSIPPLMHSPGMKAAPIASQVSEPTRSKTAPVHGTPTSRGGRRVAPVATTAQNFHPAPSTASQHSGTTQAAVSIGYQTAPTPLASQVATTPLQKISVVPSRSATDPPSIGLMSPEQFKFTSRSKSECVREEPITTLAQQPVAALAQQTVTALAQQPVTALTQEQFKDAMLYMIQHNDDFVSTLHKAYVQIAASTQ